MATYILHIKYIFKVFVYIPIYELKKKLKTIIENFLHSQAVYFTTIHIY